MAGGWPILLAVKEILEPASSNLLITSAFFCHCSLS
jgi:hypothetical protein